MTQTNEPQYWTDLFLKGQEEYMRRFSQMGGTSTGFGTAGGATSHADGAAAFAPMGNWFAQYMGATRSFWDLLAKSANQTDLNARAQEFANGLQQLFAAPAATFNGAAPWMNQDWSKLWGNFAGGQFPGGQFASGVPGSSFGAALGADMPALGLSRERQEAMQRMQAQLNEFMSQQGKLTAVWSEVITQAMRALGEQVGEKLKRGEFIDSPKRLYDMWIEVAETEFAKAAHSPPYLQAQAGVANAMSNLRTEQRVMLESYSKQLDLPTRAELNTVHKKLKEMKTEIRRLTEQLESLSAARPNNRKSPS